MLKIFIAEMIGTLLLVLLGDGVVANVLLRKSKGENGGWIVIATGWGFAVAIAVYIIGWVSGGHINPAVTLGLAILGKTAWHLVPAYFFGQLVGAMLGALLVYVSYKPHFEETEEPHKILLCFCTKPAILRPFWNFVCELIGTAVLLIGVCGILNYHNQLSGGLSPYLFGILVFSIGLSLGGPTGYAINPARDFGPRLIHFLLPVGRKGSSEWGYAWIPIVAPLMGGAIGVTLYEIASVYFFVT